MCSHASTVGSMLGDTVGSSDGDLDGRTDGSRDGLADGDADGWAVGVLEGVVEGVTLGDTVGSTAYTGDATILDPHVASESRHPCSVHNGAVFDMNVVVSRHGSPRSGFRSGVVPNR